MDEIIRTEVVGGASFPVSKIVCVGRNYVAHAREMGAEPPAEPMLFLKPSTALAGDGAVIRLPSFSDEIHHEVELVLRVSRRLCNASENECARSVDGFGVGVDLTARDVQARAKTAGHPWAVAKGWDQAAPVSPLLPLAHLADLGERRLILEVNGEVRQDGSTTSMIFSPAALLAFASTRFTLLPGDLVFTGTPEGVAAVTSGDALRAGIDPGVTLSVTFA